MEMKKLKVGDVVFGEKQLVGICRFAIDRVTKTRSFSGNNGFKREYRCNGYIEPYPQENSYSRWRYNIGSADAELRYEKQNIVRCISRVDWDSLDLDKLRKVKAELEK